MRLLVRIVTTIVLVAVLLFCVLGFMATYEPMNPSTRLTWRLVYGVTGVMIIMGLVVIHRRRAITED